MVKNIKVKVLISCVVIILGLVVIRLLAVDNKASEAGSIYLYITQEDESVVFEGELNYEVGDSFFDVIHRHFTITCATAQYQADPSCESTHAIQYILNGIIKTGQSKVILGIKGTDFELMTDWSNNFLAIYHYDNQKKSLATSGVSNIPFEDGSIFMISFEKVRG